MPLRVKILIVLTLAGAACCLGLVSGPGAHDWVRFAVYLAVILLSAEMKVAMPKGDGTMSVNFPFILLGILQLSPLQAVALGTVSVFAQCRIHVLKPFTLAQVAFNLGSVMVSTALACLAFGFCTRHGLELAPALALATTLYFLTNTIPVAMAIGWTSGECAFSLWRRRFPWFLPFYLAGAFFAAVVHLIGIHFGWMTSLLMIPTVYVIYRAYRAQIASMLARQKHLEEIRAVHLRTIEALGLAIEAKDQGTHEHLLRVRVYVGEIGRIMGQDEMQLQALLTASFLHDIGKLAVPEHIINKPGRLTPEEFDKVKIHPVVGAEILERIRFPYPVAPIVRSHHESWDGSGYPDGLKGEEIPIGARILKVVDCFDALSSDRPYRRALSLDEALAYIQQKAAIEFDPQVTAVLAEHHLELEQLAQKDRNSIAPLETSPAVTRGAAPGAGFEQYNIAGAGREESAVVSKGPAVPARPARPQDAFNLIAAARTESQAVAQMTNMLEDLSGTDGCTAVTSFSLLQWMDFDCFAIYIKEGDQLFTHYRDGVAARSLSAVPIPVGDGLSGWVADSGKPIINGNPEVEPHYLARRGSPGQLRSALSLPLCEPTGGRFGVLTLYSTKADAFSKDHLRILLAVEPKLSRALCENGGNLPRLGKLPSPLDSCDAPEDSSPKLAEASDPVRSPVPA
jgi:putative nucleotidyltransferase with HDIG domain